MTNPVTRMNSLPQKAPSQPDLINVPATAPERTGPDPHAKPTWKEWCAWDVYRRILNDPRVPDAGFRLWHWYHNCKSSQASGAEVSGFRAQAWYIAKKFGWRRGTVYKLNEVLIECLYLTGRTVQACQQIFRTRQGITELPDQAQHELPFLVPVKESDSKCASKGTPWVSGCAPAGTPGVPQEVSGCAPAGTPGVPLKPQPYICDQGDSSVKRECESAPKVEKVQKQFISAAERISLEKELDRINEQIKEILGAAPQDAWGYIGGTPFGIKERRERIVEIKRLLGSEF